MTWTQRPADLLQRSEVTTNNNISGRLNEIDEYNLQSELLDISSIRTDGGTQPRAGLDREVVDDYASAMVSGAFFPPVTVFYDGTIYWLADGYHRLEAAKKTEASIIAADVRQGTRREALLYSVGANATHGLRRTNADKRRAVMTLLTDLEWSLWSNSAIAKACGVDEGLVRLLKSQLTSDNPKTNDETLAKKCGVDVSVVLEARNRIQSLPKERTAQRNGKTYTVNTDQIGKSCKSGLPEHQLKSPIIDVEDAPLGEDEVSLTKPKTFTLTLGLPLKWQSLMAAVASAEEKETIEAWATQLIGTRLNQDLNHFPL